MQCLSTVYKHKAIVGSFVVPGNAKISENDLDTNLVAYCCDLCQESKVVDSLLTHEMFSRLALHEGFFRSHGTTS